MTQLTGISKAPRKEYAPGDEIGGKYGLLRLLGEGGMGSVWVAENMSLKANVALKLIRADVAEASANERFLSEARLAARLQHAAIVRVFDFGKTEHDEPYIVMELLEGETLGQRLGRLGAIDPMELCQTLLPIIDALHSAHSHGVIHRDLKPDNVFVAKSEGGVQPKLLDFGIAKLRSEGSFQSTKLTQAGTLIGSPDYMSPEQARGETDLDPRSDVWALCVLAYECLVGKPPFHGDNYNALLWAIIHDEPVPITVFQAGDLELWRILKKGFAKDRNVRWESARRLGEALAGWLESHGVTEDVCNRSLQSSWLPTERPTRPELAPFDPIAGAMSHRERGSSHVTSIPSPTLASMRRPHTMSLWFAGLGLLTLVGALFLSNASDDGIPTVDAEVPGNQQLGALLPVPGPAAETRDPEARDAIVQPAHLTQPLDSAPLLDGRSVDARSLDGNREVRVAQEPIGGAALARENSTGGSSWKANHQPTSPTALPTDEHGSSDVGGHRMVERGHDDNNREKNRLLEKGHEGSDGARGSTRDSTADERGDARGGDTRSSDTRTSDGVAKASGRAKSRTAAKKTAEARKPAEPKKPTEPKSAMDSEVDFGI